MFVSDLSFEATPTEFQVIAIVMMKAPTTGNRTFFASIMMTTLIPSYVSVSFSFYGYSFHNFCRDIFSYFISSSSWSWPSTSLFRSFLIPSIQCHSTPVSIWLAKSMATVLATIVPTWPLQQCSGPVYGGWDVGLSCQYRVLLQYTVSMVRLPDWYVLSFMSRSIFVVEIMVSFTF